MARLCTFLPFLLKQWPKEEHWKRSWNVNGICQVPGIENTYQVTALAQLLKDAGYHTIHCGKAHFGAVDTPGESPIHMDEYVNLAPDSPAGFGNFLKEHIFGKLPFRSINYINGNAKDLASECKRYSTLLRQHPIDIVCLGIGENGHIAFNDPHAQRCSFCQRAL